MTGSRCLPLLCQSQESHLLILWSCHCASEKLTKCEVTTMWVFLWYFLEPPLRWEADVLAYLASDRQELRLSFCALHFFRSLSFHILSWCAASNRGCKWCRTGAGVLLVCAAWCCDPSESAWKLIHWLIPSWCGSSRNEPQMPSKEPFHCWPACFEQWIPFSCVSPHMFYPFSSFPSLLSFSFYISTSWGK